MIPPLPLGISTNSLLTLVYLAFFFVFIVFGQQLQYFISIGSVSRGLERLSEAKDKAKSRLMSQSRLVRNQPVRNDESSGPGGT